MKPIVRSLSTLIPALFVAFALAGTKAAHAQPAPILPPTMPAPPSGPGATPSFTGHAPDPSDPAWSGGPELVSDPESDRTGLEVGFRTGIAFPTGSVMSGTSLSTFVSIEFPFWLSLGYRFTENVYVGIYGQYGFLTTSSCGQGESCSAYDVRGGIDLQYHLRPRGDLDPWIGYGAGYEQLGLGASSSEGSGSVHFDGFELANVQAGMDWRVTRALTLGPFGTFSVGEYSSASNGTSSPSVTQTTMHEWLTLGLRAQLM